ncbi:MAG: DUF354 domain-containing protein [Candidatus Eisenbacteria bacterium]
MHARAGKTVWIDLENSPHVPFFLPWIDWLTEAGHRVVLTARDLSQTHELLRLHGLAFDAVGGHAGGGLLGKGARGLGRALALVRWGRRQRVSLALGHGSRAQVLAARILGVPSLTFVDYEFVALRLFGLLCREVYFPDAVDPAVLASRGVPGEKLVRYPGFKEQVYLDPERDRPAPSLPPLIVIRPPARLAHYHSVQSELLYGRVLLRLAEEARHCRVLFLPRYASDRPELDRLAAAHPHFEVAREAVDGRDTLKSASLVVSGGGTMVREAAILGVRAASIFGGPVGGVDRRLSELDRLSLLRSPAEVDALPLPGAEQSAPPRPLPSTAVMRAFLRERVLAHLAPSASESSTSERS